MKHILSVHVPGEAAPHEFSLEQPVTTVGRSALNDIQLKVEEVSTRHMELHLIEGSDKIRVVDLDSTNGTTVNGQPIKEHEVSPGDAIVIGETLNAEIELLADAVEVAPAAPVVSEAAPAGSAPTIQLKKAPSLTIGAPKLATPAVARPAAAQARNPLGRSAAAPSVARPSLATPAVAKPAPATGTPGAKPMVSLQTPGLAKPAAPAPSAAEPAPLTPRKLAPPTPEPTATAKPVTIAPPKLATPKVEPKPSANVPEGGEAAGPRKLNLG